MVRYRSLPGIKVLKPKVSQSASRPKRKKRVQYASKSNSHKFSLPPIKKFKRIHGRGGKKGIQARRAAARANY